MGEQSHAVGNTIVVFEDLGTAVCASESLADLLLVLAPSEEIPDDQADQGDGNDANDDD